MPSTSEKQRRFMGAELARKRAGKKTQTDMSEKQLKEFASKHMCPTEDMSKARTERVVGKAPFSEGD